MAAAAQRARRHQPFRSRAASSAARRACSIPTCSTTSCRWRSLRRQRPGRPGTASRRTSGRCARPAAAASRSRSADPRQHAARSCSTTCDRAGSPGDARRRPADARDLRAEGLRPVPRRRARAGPDVATDAAIDASSAAQGGDRLPPLVHLPHGHTDEMAVVDGQRRVHGVQGLRVVDASIMPEVVSGNLNVPTIMMAEKVADLILGNPPLPPPEGAGVRPPAVGDAAAVARSSAAVRLDIATGAPKTPSTGALRGAHRCRFAHDPATRPRIRLAAGPASPVRARGVRRDAKTTPHARRRREAAAAITYDRELATLDRVDRRRHAGAPAGSRRRGRAALETVALLVERAG